MEQQIQQAFNDSVGVILTYLDEAGVGSAVKRAVKTEMYALCDNKIKPLLGKDQEEVRDYEGNYNR